MISIHAGMVLKCPILIDGQVQFKRESSTQLRRWQLFHNVRIVHSRTAKLIHQRPTWLATDSGWPILQILCPSIPNTFPKTTITSPGMVHLVRRRMSRAADIPITTNIPPFAKKDGGVARRTAGLHRGRRPTKGISCEIRSVPTDCGQPYGLLYQDPRVLCYSLHKYLSLSCMGILVLHLIHTGTC